MEIPDEIVHVLEPDRQPHRAGGDSGCGELLVRELAMRSGGGMDDEALRVADVGEVAPERERLDEAASALAAALEVEREYGARAGRQIAVDERAVRAVGKRGMAHRADALLVAQPFGHRERVSDVAVHSHRQRLDPEQEQERIERGEYG